MHRKAKIIATIGPSSQEISIIERLALAGMNIARLNFSHGSHESHAQVIQNIQTVRERLGLAIGILQDLQGPKIRLGKLENPIEVREGEKIWLYAQGNKDPLALNGKALPVDFPELFASVQPGDQLLLDDGRVALRAEAVTSQALQARVEVGGILSSHKGINLPGVRLRISGFTEKDKADLLFGLKHGVDAVAISFVRSAEDVRVVRQTMEAHLPPGRPMPLLIAKLERPEALENLEAILDEVDGVMIARGDLGVELPPEQVPALQKHIIRAANRRAKLVITATQMLESMISNPRPTRAEASDVANAIFDGTDAVMLSAETASGEYPVQAVEMMARIVQEAEAHFVEWGLEQAQTLLEESDAASIARAVKALAEDRDVAAVAVFTMQGHTAWLMSKVRPRVPILAFTPEVHTYFRLAFLWGVYPQKVPFAHTLEEMLAHVNAALLKQANIKPGDQVVLVCGFPVGALRPPNMALLHTVGA
ncbi:MAG: pyruvate kinase [Anaerolineales bacterium]